MRSFAATASECQTAPATNAWRPGDCCAVTPGSAAVLDDTHIENKKYKFLFKIPQHLNTHTKIWATRSTAPAYRPRPKSRRLLPGQRLNLKKKPHSSILWTNTHTLWSQNLQDDNQFGYMLVALGQQTQRQCGNWAMCPTSVQALEQRGGFLRENYWNIKYTCHNK